MDIVTVIVVDMYYGSSQGTGDMVKPQDQAMKEINLRQKIQKISIVINPQA